MQNPLPKPAKVSIGTPALPGWRVTHERVMQRACDKLRHDDESRMVRFVGNSGSGKTTAASLCGASECLYPFPMA